MAAFCTVVTADHLPFARLVFESIARHEATKHDYYVLISEQYPAATDPLIKFVDYRDIDISTAENTLKALQKTAPDTKFRWMLKPFIVKHLLARHKIVYWVDPDLYFYHDLSYANQLLSTKSFLLSPHWRCFDPFVDSKEFSRNNYASPYNGGFFGFNNTATFILDKWIAWMCYKLEVNRKLGLHDDQGYLSLFHLLDENGGLIYHRGYNLASWNRRECKRTRVADKVLINGKDEVVFIHFTHDTIKYILSKDDALLRPHLKEYVEHLLRIQSNITTLKGHSIKGILKVVQD